MDENLLRAKVKQYIEGVKNSNGRPLSKVERNNWIIEDVTDELIAINEEYRQLENLDDKKKFKNTIVAQFKTSYFKLFLKNLSDVDSSYYKNLLKSCILNTDTIEEFLTKEEARIHPKTFDFFVSFCKYQEEYSEGNQAKTKQSDNFVRTEKLQIPGTTIIDKEFVKNISENNQYTPEQFYTAMHHEESQWYGVISDYDIPRNTMSKKTGVSIEDVFKTIFNESQPITEKVSLILCGTGGVGKSTLLRKWAVNLCDESKFIVLWITSFEQFLKQGLSIIEQKSDSNFLVIIHDWDHLVLEDPKTTVRKFLEHISHVKNIRIIIGDRVPTGKVYEDYQADRNAIFELNSSENQKIIQEISQKCPQWKKTIDQLSKNPKSYSSSLYLTLFIIARLNDEGMNYTTRKPEDLFIRIIRSDLQIIAEKYIGLSKAVFYWGCAYAKYKVSISYRTFLKIAMHYQKDASITDNFDSLNRNTVTHKKLAGLISDDKGLLKFHHDVLADVGLRQVELKELGEFDDDIKLDLLNLVIDLEDDKYASSFLVKIFNYDIQLSYRKILRKMVENNGVKELEAKDHLDLTCKYEEPLFSNDEKLKYIEKLICKGNQEEQYMICLVHILIDLELDLLVAFARKILDNDIRSHVFWKFYLHNTKGDEFQLLKPKLSFFLDEKQVIKQSPLFTYQVLRFFSEEFIVQDFIYKTLVNPDWVSFNNDIIYSCLTFSKDRKLTQEFVKNVLNKDGWKKNDDYRFVLKCLEHTNWETKESFLKKVVTDSDYHVIEKFFEQCRKFSNKEIIEQFIKIATNNKEGDHPDVIRNILFMEEVGLSGYL